MNSTKIEWVLNPDGTPGYSWNPITGCLNDCPYCYAKRLATTRLRGRAGYGPVNPFKPKYHKDKLEAPLKRKKPSGIFVADMGDLFGSWVPKEWIMDVLSVMSRTPQHIYYLLTKNPERYSEFIEHFPRNILAGATVDKNTEYNRITALRAFKTKMRIERGWAPRTYISFEPMLTPMLDAKLGDIDWVIIGGITKSKYREPGYPLRYGERPPKKEWVEDLLRCCLLWDGIKIFQKNNLSLNGERRQEHPLTQK